MRIGWVGGLDRARAEFERRAAREGHLLEVHTGHVEGRGIGKLEALVARCDLVVIVTELNSHGGVLRAKELAERHATPSMLVRKSSLSTLEKVLGDLRSGVRAA